MTDMEKALYCHTVWSEYRRGFGMDIGFTDHLNTQVVSTLNYSVIADFRTLLGFSSPHYLH
jgi:hypothetical protein